MCRPRNLTNGWRPSSRSTDVVGSDNEKIGDVSDILFDKSGKVEAFVISVGGVLGVGAKEVALAPELFRCVPGQNGSSNKLKLAATKDELKDAQTFARYEPPKPTGTTGSGNSMGGGGMRPAGTSLRPAAVNLSPELDRVRPGQERLGRIAAQALLF